MTSITSACRGVGLSTDLDRAGWPVTVDCPHCGRLFAGRFKTKTDRDEAWRIEEEHREAGAAIWFVENPDTPRSRILRTVTL